MANGRTWTISPLAGGKQFAAGAEVGMCHAESVGVMSGWRSITPAIAGRGDSAGWDGCWNGLTVSRSATGATERFIKYTGSTILQIEE